MKVYASISGGKDSLAALITHMERGGQCDGAIYCRITSSRVRLMANLQAAVAEAVSGTMEERGRGFASDREAWAELKECIERTKQMHTDIEKVHKEMWSAVKDRNEDAFAALSQEFERSSRILAEEWAQTSALAKIAVISESND